MPYIRPDRSLPPRKRRRPLLAIQSGSQVNPPGARLNQVTTGMFRSMPTLWPDRFLTKMRKVQAYSVANTVLHRRQMHINNLWEPSSSNNNLVKPAGYDELRDLYRWYYVKATKVTLTVLNQSPDQPINAMMYRNMHATSNNLPNPEPGSLAEMMGATGNPYAVWGTLGIAGSEKEKLVLTQYATTSKLVGMDSSKTKEFTCDTDVSTDQQPGQRVEQHIYLCNPNLVSLQLNCYYFIEFTYWVEWFSRRNSEDV